MVRTSVALAALTLALGTWTTSVVAQGRPGEGPAFGETGNSGAAAPSATNSSPTGVSGSTPTSRALPNSTPDTNRSVTDTIRPQPGNAPPTTRSRIGSTPTRTDNSVTDSGSLNLNSPTGTNLRQPPAVPRTAADSAPQPAPMGRPMAQASGRPMGHAMNRPMHGGMGRAPAATGDVNAAYMGGGMVMERGPDGTLHPVN